jgi:hypothetical protein
MQASANLEADIPYGVPHGAGAPDGPGRPVEGGEEAVAGCVDLGAAEPVQQPADPRVMLIEQVPPAPVAELAGCLGRPDEVGEQHRGQAPVEIRCSLHASQELLDHIQQGFSVTDICPIVAARKLGTPGIRDQLRRRPHRRQVEQPVPDAVHDQRPGLDGRQDRPQIEFRRPAPASSRGQEQRAWRPPAP